MLNKEITQRLAIKYNTTKNDIEHVYREYWKWIKQNVSIINLKDMEEPQPIHANISIPGIGELVINENSLKHLNERHCNKKDKTDE